jgi:hypothetical protein
MARHRALDYTRNYSRYCSRVAIGLKAASGLLPELLPSVCKACEHQRSRAHARWVLTRCDPGRGGLLAGGQGDKCAGEVTRGDCRVAATVAW